MFHLANRPWSFIYMSDVTLKANLDTHDSTTLKVKVLFFAATRERTGCQEASLTLDAPSTLRDLKAKLYLEHPTLSELDSYLRWALNERFEPSFDRSLSSGDVVALIPPISGG